MSVTLASWRESRNLRAFASRLRGLSPSAIGKRRRESRERDLYELQLVSLSDFNRAPAIRDGAVLVDGTFDNPNYWLRYALLRAAGLRSTSEVGLIGPWRRREVTGTFRRLGIDEIIDGVVDARPFRAAAERLAAQTRSAGDLANWVLPLGFPWEILYDGLLKRQRAATVDVTHRSFVDDVAEALAEIDRAVRVTASRRWSAFVLSHAVNFRYAALAWIAAANGIPVFVAFGNYGTPRYWRMDTQQQISDCIDRPTGAELDRLPPDRAEAVATAGRHYLDVRLGGGTTDIGSLYAFGPSRIKIDRAAIATAFGWPIERPIVTVYASNWFDFPHGLGMTLYRDFLEWIEVTLRAAAGNTRVSWLFRAHPCDEWYGGQTLADVMPPDAPPHVRLCPASWHGAAVLEATDAVVTAQGTVGIEAAFRGRPVLLADKGWYHDCGFAVWPRTIEDYTTALGQGWDHVIDRAYARRRAETFAGIYFGLPDWQAPLISGDDSEQAALHPKLTALLAARPAALGREIDTIAAWLQSPHRFYHTFKMQAAS